MGCGIRDSDTDDRARVNGLIAAHTHPRAHTHTHTRTHTHTLLPVLSWTAL